MRKGAIDYAPLRRKADLHLVRLVLEQFERGNHEVYLTFDKAHPGVTIPRGVMALPGPHICAVLHRVVADLLVTETQVSATLKFQGVPSRWVIPFDALTLFYDCRTPVRMEFESQVNAAPVIATEAANDGVVCFESFRRQRHMEKSA